MKYPEFVGLRLSTDTINAARQQAESEDRTLSAYLRRIIIAALKKRDGE